MPKRTKDNENSEKMIENIVDLDLVDKLTKKISHAIEVINDDITEQLDLWPTPDLINELYNFGVLNRQEISGVDPFNLMHSLPHFLVDDEDYFVDLCGIELKDAIEYANKSKALGDQIEAYKHKAKEASNLYDHSDLETTKGSEKVDWILKNYPEIAELEKLEEDKKYLDGLISEMIKCFVKAMVIPEYFIAGNSEENLLEIAKERLIDFTQNEIKCQEYRVRRHGYFFAKEVVDTKDRFDEDFDFEIFSHHLTAIRNYLIDLPPSRLTPRCKELLALLGIYFQMCFGNDFQLASNAVDEIHNLLLVNHRDMCAGYLLDNTQDRLSKKDNSPDFDIHVFTSYRDTYPTQMTQSQVDYMLFVLCYKLGTIDIADSLIDIFDPLNRIEIIFKMQIEMNPVDLFTNFFNWGSDANSQEVAESCIYLIFLVPYLHITPKNSSKFSLFEKFEENIKNYLNSCNNTKGQETLKNLFGILKKIRQNFDIYLNSEIFEEPWTSSISKFWKLAAEGFDIPEVTAMSYIFNK